MHPEDEVVREIGGKSIRWRDSDGVEHAVEAAEAVPGVVLCWTLCGSDCPAGVDLSMGNGDVGIDCPVCLRRLRGEAEPPTVASIGGMNEFGEALLRDLAANDNEPADSEHDAS